MEMICFGARIAQRRREKEMTQEALANALGVTNQAVSKWEADQCCPDVQLLPALADTLGFTLDELFGREAPHADAAPESAVGGLPWADDDSLHAVLFRGHSLLMPRDGTVRFDRYDRERDRVELHFTGSVHDIESDFAVVCRDCTIAGDVRANESVSCGDVGGSVTAGDGVNCGSVGGDAHANDGMNCGDVTGSVSAGDSVYCGNVGGSVRAGDGVTCGNVGGDVTAGDGVRCASIHGNVSSSDGVRAVMDSVSDTLSSVADRLRSKGL